MQDRARIVIVGAGIVGCSTAYDLTRLGWTDIVVVDQGPLFETGGSTSHAPGLVFQVNPSRTVSKLAQDTVHLYESLNEGEREPIWYSVGSFEVATTPERLEELKRRQGYAASWDLPASLLDPAKLSSGCRCSIASANPGRPPRPQRWPRQGRSGSGQARWR